jgi:hypothetical protein
MEDSMKRLAPFVLLIVLIPACALVQQSQTLGRVRADLECILYEKGMGWKQISEKLGGPDITPLPEPGTGLTKNVRGYRDKVILFYVEKREVSEGEKARFQEVVTAVEVCRKK